MGLALAWLIGATVLWEGIGADELVLQPASYASPDGTVVLRVDPHDRIGLEGAHYELLVRGVRVWETELDVAVRSAAVTDDARAAGFGFTDMPMEGTAAHFVVFGPQGELVARHAIEGTLEGSCDGPWLSPAVTLAQPELERWIVLYRDGHGLFWQAFGLERGTPRSGRTPVTGMPGERDLLFQAGTAIPGTSVFLATFQQSPDPGERTGVPAAPRLRHALVDRDGECIWTREEQRFPPELDTLQDEHLVDTWAVLGTGERSFVLWDVDEMTRTTLAVVPDGESWSVRAGRPSAYRIDDPFEALPALVSAAPVRIELATAGLEGGLARAVLAPAGERVVLQGSRRGALVFVDASGTGFSTFAPDASPLQTSPIGRPSLVWSRDGELFARHRDGTCSRFARDSRFLGSASVPPAERPGPWRFGKIAVEQLGTPGAATGRIERRPDGKWFGEIVASAVLDDGAAIVVDVPAMASSPPTPTTLSFLGRDPACIALPFVPEAYPYRLQVTEHWILVGTGGPRAFLCRRSDRELCRVEAPDEPGRMRWEHALTEDESELRALAYEYGGRAVLFRSPLAPAGR